MEHVAQRLRQNLDRIRGRIETARARGAHATEGDVELVVVTKSVEPWVFDPLHAAGVRAVGENRVQTARKRRSLGPSDWTWHGIGHLQRNKAAVAVDLFDVFQALDSERLARRLEDLLAARRRVWPVYVQVNAAADPAKGGLAPESVRTFLEMVTTQCPHLEPVGLMTMARLGGSEGDVRATFRTLRDVRDDVVRLGVGRAPIAGLSMGMTDDFEPAVEEGATLVRVGRAVFDGIPRNDPMTERKGA